LICKIKRRKKKLLLLCVLCFFAPVRALRCFVLQHTAWLPSTSSAGQKKKSCCHCRFSLALLPSPAAFPLCSRRRLLLFGMASPSVPPSGCVQITQCPVLFNGTNYCDWVPRYACVVFVFGSFLVVIPCQPLHVAPFRPTIPDNFADAIPSTSRSTSTSSAKRSPWVKSAFSMCRHSISLLIS